jgi:hypothetical protein
VHSFKIHLGAMLAAKFSLKASERGSRNHFPNFGTLSGESVKRSYPDVHFRSDPLPAGALRAKYRHPPRIHD